MKIDARLFRSLAALVLLSSACGGSPVEVVEEIPGTEHARIASFTVAPGVVDVGGEVTVSWQTEHAVGIQLARNGSAVDLGDAGAAEGSVTVVVDEASTFVLAATGKTDVVATESRAVQVSAVPRPTIGSFVAEPATVVAGEAATLRWRTEGAGRIRIVDGAGADLELGDAHPAEGSVVTPALEVATTFTLVAEREGAPSSETSVTVRVSPKEAVRIVSFAAEPAEVEEGGASRLTWITENAEEVHLFEGAAELDLQGQGASGGAVKVFPDGAQTYRLVATKGDQADEKTVLVRVVGHPLATLAVSPSPIALGESATLTWTSEDAEVVRIVDSSGEPLEGGDVEPNGTRTIQARMTTTFTIAAVGASGKESHAAATVEVRPEVSSFVVVDGLPAGAGDLVELEWKTGAATSVEISNLSGSTLTFTGAEAVEGRATMPVGEEGRFEIVAKSGRLETRQAADLQPMDEPAIGEFRVERDVVGLHDGVATVRLSWSGVNRASTLELTDSNLGQIELGTRSIEADFVDVEIQQDTRFTLTARSDAGMAAATVEVRAVPLPEVISVSASPDYVGPGEDVELTWVTTGSTLVEIEANGVAIAGPHPTSGSLVYPVSLATTFEVKAYNDALDRVIGKVDVAVGGPQLLSFASSTTNAWTGSAVTFDWETSGAGSLRLSADGSTLHSTSVRSDVAEGSFTTAPLVAGEYDFILEIENAIGARRTSTIHVRVGSGPTIDSFTVNPSLLLAGTDATVQWTAGPDPDGALPTLSLTANRGGPYGLPALASGSASFTLDEAGAYDFTLTATTGSNGSVAATIQRSVTVYGPPAVTLVANPPVFDDQNDTQVDLTWTSVNADASLELFMLDGANPPVLLSSIAAGVRDAGTIAAAAPTEATTYRIVATNGLGMVAQQDVTVTMEGTLVLSFDATPVEVYPSPPAPPEVAVVAGDEVELSWTTKRATSVSIDAFEGMVLGAGSPYVDITTMGATPAPLQIMPGRTDPGDEGYVDITFPQSFTFPFRGTDQTAMRVTSNGVVTFDFTPFASLANTYTNVTLGPTQTYPFAHIVPFWDDLYNAANAVSWLLGSDAVSGEQFVIVQWKGVGFTSTTSGLNFQAVLFESGAIEFRYGSMTYSTQARADGNDATIGVNAGGNNYKQVVPTNTAVPGGLSGKSYRFTYPPSLPIDGSIGWAPPGTSSAVTRTVKITASGIGSDSRTADVVVYPRAAVSLQGPAVAPIRDTPFDLAWTTANATAVQIVDSTGMPVCTGSAAELTAGRGSCSVTATTTGARGYTAIATGALGHSVTAETDVTVVSPEFQISSFEVSDSMLVYGDPVTLSWETGDADVLTITANGQPISLPPTIDFDSDSFTIPVLSEKTTFILTIENLSFSGLKTATQTVTVRTFDLTITADATDVAPGDPVTLSWSAASLTGTPPRVDFALPMADVSSTSAYQDISGFGNLILGRSSTAADQWVTVDFANNNFSFPYFGETYTKLRVGNQGLLSFLPSMTGYKYQNYEMPSADAAALNVAFALFWGDVQLATTSSTFTDGGIYAYYNPSSAGGLASYTIQYHHHRIYAASDGVTDLNFQIELFEDGSFEMRYGTMNPATGTNTVLGGAKTVGYQVPDGSAGYSVHYGGAYSSSPGADKTYPGGFANKSFRFVPAQSSGSLIVNPRRTTTYKVCAELGGYTHCETVTVTAEFEIGSFSASAEAIDPGEGVDLSWVTKGADAFALKAGSTTIATETDVDPATGTLTVFPTGPTTYSLEVTNTFLNQTLTQTKTIIVRTVHVDLTASAPSVLPGESATLSWNVTSLSGGQVSIESAHPMEEVSATSPFVDITGLPDVSTLSMSSDDSGYANVTFPAPFAFNYMGGTYTAARVFVDGYISFNTAASQTSANRPIPDTGYKQVHLAPFWDDIHLRTGSVLAGMVGNSYVIQWKGVSPYYGSNAPTGNNFDLNFQIVLNDDGSFEYRYGTMAPPPNPSPTYCEPDDCVGEANASSAAIGYQNPAGTKGFTLHNGGATYNVAANVPFPGGLEDRSFRYQPLALSGTTTVTIDKTTTFEICATESGYTECDFVTITVPSSGDFLITELMLDPTGGSGQWFEARNMTGNPVDLVGWEVETDVGMYSIASPMTVQPGEYVTFSTTPAPGFTPTLVLSGMSSLGDPIGGFVSLKAGTADIAKVEWDGAWTFDPGGSLEFDVNKQRKGLGVQTDPASFCPASTSFDGGVNLGTPGSHGSGCPGADYLADYFSVKPAIDISSIAVQIPGATGATTRGTAVLPFNFPFYSGTYGTVYPTTCGLIGISAMTSNCGLTNYALPSTVDPASKGVIASFWGYLVAPSTGTGSAKWATVTVGTQQVAVFQFENWKTNTGTGNVNYQVQLWENGDIVIVYLNLVGTAEARGSISTVGLQEPGTSNPKYLQYSFNEETLSTGQSIYFHKR